MACNWSTASIPFAMRTHWSRHACRAFAAAAVSPRCARPFTRLQVWIQPGTGLADDYLQALESLTSSNPEATILAILFVFACFHSGLAGLRPQGACVLQ